MIFLVSHMSIQGKHVIWVLTKTGSIAIAATTLDSLLDLTHISMRNVNNYDYPIGKLMMQPVGMIIFAAIMATLGSFVAPLNFFFWSIDFSCVLNARVLSNLLPE
jgi:hypothetical protein